MFSSEAVTRGIRVRVQSEYAAEQSRPAHNEWFFLYTVTISNEGTEPVQLVTRRAPEELHRRVASRERFERLDVLGLRAVVVDQHLERLARERVQGAERDLEEPRRVVVCD